MSMAKKKEDGFENAPARKSDALSASYVGPRTREPTQSGIKLSPAARPAASAPKAGPQVKPPPAPRASGVEDADWWAESTLNATFDSSNVVAIEDPNDPSYGDRVTPVFLESITPVFPESKVREVMALADAYERASERSILAAKPAAVARAPEARPAPVHPEVARLAPTPVAPPVLQAQAAVVAAPVQAAPAARPVAPKLGEDFVRGRASVAPGAGMLTSLDRMLGGAPVFDPEVPEDLLHTASFASKGADMALVMWVAMALVIVLVAATMLTVG